MLLEKYSFNLNKPLFFKRIFSAKRYRNKNIFNKYSKNLDKNHEFFDEISLKSDGKKYLVSSQESNISHFYIGFTVLEFYSYLPYIYTWFA